MGASSPFTIHDSLFQPFLPVFAFAPKNPACWLLEELLIPLFPRPSLFLFPDLVLFSPHHIVISLLGPSHSPPPFYPQFVFRPPLSSPFSPCLGLASNPPPLQIEILLFAPGLNVSIYFLRIFFTSFSEPQPFFSVITPRNSSLKFSFFLPPGCFFFFITGLRLSHSYLSSSSFSPFFLGAFHFQSPSRPLLIFFSPLLLAGTF